MSHVSRILCLVLATAVALGQEMRPNLPPVINLAFPPPGYDVLLGYYYVRLNATASDPDGSVARVEFFSGTNRVGVATRVPYSVTWKTPLVPGESYPKFNLTAVAVDDLGAQVQSRVHEITVFPAQFRALLKLVSPADEEVFPAPATFEFAVELLIRADPPELTSPVEFYLGTNLLERIEREPYSVLITNLAEGEYTLSVRYRGSGGDGFCACPQPVTIRVAKAGIRSASLTRDGQVRFGAFNTEEGKAVVVQASSNLQAWIPLLTNSPPASSFYFLDDATQANRYYRLLVQPP